DVVVEGHRPRAELPRHAPHRERLEALLVGDADRGTRDAVAGVRRAAGARLGARPDALAGRRGGPAAAAGLAARLAFPRHVVHRTAKLAVRCTKRDGRTRCMRSARTRSGRRDWASATASCGRCAASTWRSRRARCWACWDTTGRARPR